MIVVVIISIIFMRVSPMISEIKSRSALRAARQELSAVFATARAAAMQKARAATVTLATNSATVTVTSSVNGSTVTLAGPFYLSKAYGTSLAALGTSPTTVVFDGRGIVTPATTTIAKYRLTASKWADTVCISGAGVVLIHGCSL